MTDGLRLAVGTLTAIPVKAPGVISRATARNAMLWAPPVGLLIGLVAEVMSLLVRWAVPGWNERLLTAAVGVATLAVVTRGLHLDGLADTADGLGSGQSADQSADQSLAIMRRSDIGPFGVITLVLVLLLQVAALDTALLVGRGTLALVGGAVVARLAITWACRQGVAAARSDGLGATVAGTVPVLAAVVMTASVFLLLALVTWWDDDVKVGFLINVAVALVAALLVAQLLVRHCVRRFGGITGDVLGAACETAFLVFLLVIAAR
ncbi:MAG TPA: adenosylcobinamide-GDP ribazoletransferase [Actinomycetes bacterium]|nr:adenosylcobinamide-GDP ribazoletransferase [Actinomycetes bacterium]